MGSGVGDVKSDPPQPQHGEEEVKACVAAADSGKTFSSIPHTRCLLDPLSLGIRSVGERLGPGVRLRSLCAPVLCVLVPGAPQPLALPPRVRPAGGAARGPRGTLPNSTPSASSPFPPAGSSGSIKRGVRDAQGDLDAPAWEVRQIRALHPVSSPLAPSWRSVSSSCPSGGRLQGRGGVKSPIGYSIGAGLHLGVPVVNLVRTMVGVEL